MAKIFNREYYLLILTRELLFYLVFLFCVTFSAVAKIDHMAYFLTKAVKGQLAESRFLSDKNEEMYFNEIKTVGQFYSYLDEVVSKKIFKDTFSKFEAGVSSNPSKDRGLLYYNRLLSQPTIRQVTTKNFTCHQRFRSYFKICHNRYSIFSKSKTKLEGDSGQEYEHTPSIKRKKDGRNFGTGGVVYWGNVAVYESGGFFRRLGTTKKKFRGRINRLKMAGWLKQESRAVFVDMQFYNPHLDLFAVVKLVFEMPPTGQLIPTIRVNTFQCEKEHKDKIIRMAEGCMIVYALYILYYFAEEIRQIVFFRNCLFWSIINWIIISASIAHFICYIVEKYKCLHYYSVYVGNTNTYYPLQEIALLESINTNAQGVALFFVYFKLLKYMHLNRSLGHVYYTLRRSGNTLFNLFGTFIVMIYAFAAAGHILFGTQVAQFSTVYFAMMTLLSTFVGDFYYGELKKYHWRWAAAYFTTYIIMLFLILVHLFLAVLSCTYTEVKTDLGIAPHRIHLCGLWGRGCANCLKDCGCTSCVPKSLAKNRYSATAEEIRTILRRCGFSKMDVDIFMARYNLNQHMEVSRKDVPKLIENIKKAHTAEIRPGTTLIPQAETSTEATLKQARKIPAIGVDEFTAQQNRIDRLENIMGVIAEKLERLLKMMNTLDQLKGPLVPPRGRGKK